MPLESLDFLEFIVGAGWIEAGGDAISSEHEVGKIGLHLCLPQFDLQLRQVRVALQ
jgi:hypothetical protein